MFLFNDELATNLEFSAAIHDLPIGEALIRSCATAIHAGHPVGCADVEHSTGWAPGWRSLCLATGTRACQLVDTSAGTACCHNHVPVQ